MGLKNTPPRSFQELWDSLPFQQRKWADVIRVKPEAVEPPFTWDIVEQAVRYYMEHDEPWLPYAKPEEEYGTLWDAVSHLGGYGLELQAEDEQRLIEKAEAWIEKENQALKSYLLGEPGPEPDLLHYVDHYCLYDGFEAYLPEELRHDWLDISDEERLARAREHLRAGGDGMPDFETRLREEVPAEYLPQSGAAAEFGWGFTLELPIGYAQRIDDAGMLGDAIDFEIAPEIALTFFQIWLDHTGWDTRVELMHSRQRVLWNGR